MRLGGPVDTKGLDPEGWAKAARAQGYGAVYAPVGDAKDESIVAKYREAAAKADLVIAEVGAWSNPLSPDAAKAKEGLERNIAGLALADLLGARCCVNIVGSRSLQWDGPHPDNLTPATFDLIVETARKIIDAVKPTRTFYTLETMPFMFPDSADSYLQLLKAIDRPRFAVHLDPVNLICSPQRYYGSAALIKECFAKLGPQIKSCHAKDIILRPILTTHLDEVPIGQGGLDYGAYLSELSKLDPSTPLMMEHMKMEEYPPSAEHLRKVAREKGLSFA